MGNEEIIKLIRAGEMDKVIEEFNDRLNDRLEAVRKKRKYIETPSTEMLMKVFRIFDKHGLIRDDLCFDPEHFMETVVREHWNDYDF